MYKRMGRMLSSVPAKWIYVTALVSCMLYTIADQQTQIERYKATAAQCR